MHRLLAEHGGRIMEMKILSASERQNFYITYLTKDFHESEVKPFEMIEKFVNQGNYLCYGFFEDSEPFGYAYFTKSVDERVLFLDYFAVVKTHRSKGLGSHFLTEMKSKLFDTYAILMLECENPTFSLNEKDKRNRIRRIKFYLKNGFKQSNILSRVLTDEYEILTLDLGKPLPEHMLFDELQQIYNTLFGKEFFEQNINMRICS